MWWLHRVNCSESETTALYTEREKQTPKALKSDKKLKISSALSTLSEEDGDIEI